MFATDPHEFDIDVDVSSLLIPELPHSYREPILIDSLWYTLARPGSQRSRAIEAAIQQCFSDEIRRAQWRAVMQRHRDRRGAKRAPILSRLHIDGADPMVACDVSATGLRASGRPATGQFDVEFKLPGVQFPVDARAEVIDFKDRNVIPLVSLRFTSIDKPYQELIERYVARKSAQRAA